MEITNPQNPKETRRLDHFLTHFDFLALLLQYWHRTFINYEENFPMQTQHFARFAPVIKSLSVDDLAVTAAPSEKLRLAQSGAIEVIYAPFEYINTAAKVVLCGITPGLQQATIALLTAGSALRAGQNVEAALAQAKNTASFAGPMRSNLVAMLDHIGLSQRRGIDSAAVDRVPDLAASRVLV